MIIEYKGKILNTTKYKQMTDKTFSNLKEQYYKKPNINIINEDLYKVLGEGSLTTNITRYYFRDLMSKVTLYHSKWSIEDAFEHKPILEFLYGKTVDNEDVFPKDQPLIKRIETAMRLAGKGVVTKPSDFKLDTVRNVLKKYNLNDNYYDMSCGWGVRLMGSLSCGINYFGTDPNNLLVDKLNELAVKMQDIDLFAPSVDIRCQGSEEFIPEWVNTMGVAFTSPPYFTLEDYGIGEKQSIKQHSNYKDWCNIYYKGTMENVYKYLISGGAMLINIKNFGKYDLEEKTIEIAESVGFKFVGTELFENITRIKSDGELMENNENIFIFRKDKR